MYSSMKPLPPAMDLETKPVLRQAMSANRALAELKGIVQSIPNQAILLNTLALQEAKDSSAVENIITTHDDLYKEGLFPEVAGSIAAKEVRDYNAALKKGYDLIGHNGLLLNSHILAIQAELERNNAGFRTSAGTTLKNDATGEIVYEPPQHPQEIIELMSNLERFINDDEMCDADPLVKMCILHHQFESIHPFYDGNGRTGRILNILYMVLKGLLDIPVLYLSRYIVQTKGDYYERLQAVRDHGQWEEWNLYMLKGVELTARATIEVVNSIHQVMRDYKHRIRDGYKFYSQDLIDNLFTHPYTKIEFVERDLNVKRVTAAKYLDSLVEGGFLYKEKLGRSNYYVNIGLYKILNNPPVLRTEDLP